MMLPQSKSVLAMEVAALVVVGSASVWPLPVHTHPFVERDPELSMPYVEDAVVSPLLLFVLVLVVAPAAWVLQLAAMRRWSTLKHPALADWRVALLTMYWSLALATALTVLIKCFCGRPRPSFREARESGDYEAYLAATDPLALGDIGKCQDTDAVRRAFSSFPSGHSSMSFATFVPLGLSVLHMPSRSSWLGQRDGIRVALAFMPIFAAMLVAGTRVRDSWHHFADIVAGSILGMGVAVAVFSARYGATLHSREKRDEDGRVEADSRGACGTEDSALLP